MKNAPPNSPEAISGLIFAVFKLSSRLIMASTTLVSELGLTSARWEVLGEIVVVGKPRTVADLARDIGGTRQNVLRIVNHLVEAGLLEFIENPGHRRAQLVVPSPRGFEVFAQAVAILSPLSDELARGVSAAELERVTWLLVNMHHKIDATMGKMLDTPEERACT